MPPTTRSSVSKTPGKTDSQTSVLEQMADDAAPELPTEYPAGAPELKPLLAVRPRSRRGEFKRVLAEISEKSNAARDAQVELEKTKDARAKEQALFRLSASMDDVLEVIEQAMRLVAVDVAKYDTWAAEVGDDDLQTTWAVYQQRMQPGEAPSSPS